MGEVADEVVNEEMDDSLERATTTATSLDVEQDRGDIIKTQSKATPNEPSSLGTSSGGNTLRSGEDRLKLEELMELCTKLQQRVLELENTKTSQDTEIAKLKRRVKKLKKKKRPRTHVLKRLRKGRKINDIDIDEDITLVNDQDDTDMFSVNDLDGDEVVVVEQEVAAKDLTIDKVTLAQALAALKSAKPKVKANVVEEPSLPVSIAVQRLQVREQEELTIEERAKLFQQLLEKRRKHFAAKRAEEKRNKPPTRAQQRSIMCTYLKNMEGWKPKSSKNKTELVEESSKKAEAEIAHESILKRAGEELE
ncbi:hypothetical protein Tco_1169922 [Tanacetum coccineum]